MNEQQYQMVYEAAKARADKGELVAGTFFDATGTRCCAIGALAETYLDSISPGHSAAQKLGCTREELTRFIRGFDLLYTNDNIDPWYLAGLRMRHELLPPAGAAK